MGILGDTLARLPPPEGFPSLHDLAREWRDALVEAAQDENLIIGEERILHETRRVVRASLEVLRKLKLDPDALLARRFGGLPARADAAGVAIQRAWGHNARMDPGCYYGWANDEALMTEAERLERELRANPGDPKLKEALAHAVAHGLALALAAWRSTDVPWDDAMELPLPREG